MSGVHAFGAETPDGARIDFARYAGKVLLIVNTASECVFTPQYEGLETLYRQFHAQGLEVLGFPCNQFGGQEPGSAEEIGSFCKKNYQLSFPLLARVDVNGEHTHPLFQYLKKAAPGLMGSQSIKWNFTKFLMRKDGSVYKRYAPQTEPKKLLRDIKTLLAE